MNSIISWFAPLYLVVFFSYKVSSQLIARLTLHNLDSKIAAPVYINLEDITSVADSSVYQGTISTSGAENTWKSFSHPPQVPVIRVKSN